MKLIPTRGNRADAARGLIPLVTAATRHNPNNRYRATRVDGSSRISEGKLGRFAVGKSPVGCGVVRFVLWVAEQFDNNVASPHDGLDVID